MVIVAGDEIAEPDVADDHAIETEGDYVSKAKTRPHEQRDEKGKCERGGESRPELEMSGKTAMQHRRHRYAVQGQEGDEQQRQDGVASGIAGQSLAHRLRSDRELRKVGTHRRSITEG